MGKIAVITCNFGNFDKPKELPKQSVDFDRYYITEENCPYPMAGLDNRLKAKVGKMLAHMFIDAEVFIWVDGNVQIKSSYFVENMSNMGRSDILISRHPQRATVGREGDFILKELAAGNKYLNARYDKKGIEWELEKCGHDLPMYWCGLFSRRNSKFINKRFEDWWNMAVMGSNFDQMNFSECMKEAIIRPVRFGDFYDNDTYELIPHNYTA